MESKNLNRSESPPPRRLMTSLSRGSLSTFPRLPRSSGSGATASMKGTSESRSASSAPSAAASRVAPICCLSAAAAAGSRGLPRWRAASAAIFESASLSGASRSRGISKISSCSMSLSTVPVRSSSRETWSSSRGRASRSSLPTRSAPSVARSSATRFATSARSPGTPTWAGACGCGFACPPAPGTAPWRMPEVTMNLRTSCRPWIPAPLPKLPRRCSSAIPGRRSLTLNGISPWHSSNSCRW